MITQERLKELLHYVHETGVFTWLVDRGPKKRGSVAGSCMNTGYFEIVVDYRRYLSHRLALFYVHGEFPNNQIDHINGIRSDNRISNLREATHAENAQNLRNPRSDNKTGFLGVSRNRNKFRAQIHINGNNTFLGNFLTPESAHAAYLQAKREHHTGCSI